MDERDANAIDSARIGRRDWLRSAAGGFVVASGMPHAILGPQQAAQPEDAKVQAVEEDFHTLEKRMEAARIGPLHQAQTTHYQGIGDEPEAFIKLMLEDCERLAADFLAHFRARGFEVQMPKNRLLVAIFHDERSFGRFMQLPSPKVPRGAKTVLQATGVYDRKTNVLHVFDWRNVPMTPRSATRNTETIAHEGTHQLTFNTGLIRRDRDVPGCIVEGLGTYGEARITTGTSEFGRRNVRRLDELAKIQRQIPWIPIRELIQDDTILRMGKAGRVLLGYAQSWLLIHYLMKTPAETPRFREYLKAIADRTAADHRIEDAKTHLGDLDALDRNLKRYSIRLLSTI